MVCRGGWHRKCGGATGGVLALNEAAISQHIDIMAILTDAGVVDTGLCLANAAGYTREASVKFLLQQAWRTSDAVGYLNAGDNFGRTPLTSAVLCLETCCPSPRIVWLLLDAGADATSIVDVTDGGGRLVSFGTPLGLARRMLRDKKISRGQDATQEQLHGLERIHRLLLREEAAHAISWSWPGDTPSSNQAVKRTAKSKKLSTPVASVIPILRLRAARPRVLLTALLRLVV